MSFNRAQTRVVIGLLTGHNTLRRHLHILGLTDSPLCRASLRHTYLGSLLLEPEDIQSISLGAMWNFSKAIGLP